MSTFLSHCRILVVDDDDANVGLITRVLRGAGYPHVRGITDAREVPDLRQSWAPDLVVLDLHMPHLDGISLLERLRAGISGSEFVPVLVLTADVERETLKRALTAGANDYLTKPVDIDELLLRVRNLLAIRVSHEDLKSSNAVLASALRQRMQIEEQESQTRRERATAMHAVIERGPNMVFQPVIDLGTGRAVGVEALARFEGSRSPDRWFAEARALALGTELELAAVRAALAQLERLEPDWFMAVNVSPGVLLDSRLHDLVTARGRDRVVVEITEHEPVESYDDLGVARSRMGEHGVRVAVDDAGAGYACLHHILRLAPDIIKLDISLTRDIDRDPVKRALAAALVQFARESGAVVTAEGVETAGELDTLRSLEIPWGQGFHFGRPGPLDRCRADAARLG